MPEVVLPIVVPAGEASPVTFLMSTWAVKENDVCPNGSGRRCPLLKEKPIGRNMGLVGLRCVVDSQKVQMLKNIPLKKLDFFCPRFRTTTSDCPLPDTISHKSLSPSG